MRTEDETNPNQRYLFANSYFSDKAIEIWKSECVIRCKDIPKDNAYENFITWKRGVNEIAVFTMYAYADLLIPKTFDIIFQTDMPNNFVETKYEIVQSIYEAWLPSNTVEHGHKHLCIFQFQNAIPDILSLLHRQDEKFSTCPTGKMDLGFCNSADFDGIISHINKIKGLKEQ